MTYTYKTLAVPYGLALLLATLCGCKTVRQAREAQSETSRLVGEVTITAAQAGLTDSRPYALTNLEEIARHYHPSILEARQAVESARIQCRLARSGRLPQINTSGSYSRQTKNAQNRRPFSTETDFSWSGSVGLDLLLYDFGKLDAHDSQAIESLIAAEEQLRSAQLDVVYTVRTTFFELHRSAELYRVACESEKQYAEHLEEARTMVQVGTRRQYDVTKAEVDWGNAALQVITASNTLFVARAQLNRALGLAEYPSYSVQDDLMPPRAEPDVDALMTLARENEPALAVLRARARSASAYVDQTVAELYPDLSLGASYDLSGTSFPLTWNYGWALRAAQDLFTGFRKTHRISDAVTQLRIARTRVANAEQTHYLDIVSAVAQHRSAIKRLEIAGLVARQAAENRDIVNEQYRVGVSSAIERTDAQVAVTQAQADVVRARYDEQAAQANLARLSGEPVAPAETVPKP